MNKYQVKALKVKEPSRIEKIIEWAMHYSFLLALIVSIESLTGVWLYYQNYRLAYEILVAIVCIQFVIIGILYILRLQAAPDKERRAFLYPLLACAILALIIIGILYSFSKPHITTLDEYKTPQPIEIIPRGPQ